MAHREVGAVAGGERVVLTVAVDVMTQSGDSSAPSSRNVSRSAVHASTPWPAVAASVATFAGDQMSESSHIPRLLEQISYLREVPIVGILRGYDTPAAVEAARVVADRGIRVLEVTIDSENALETIGTLANIEEVVVGVGTVTEASQVAQAVSAGATFVVTPIYDRETLQASLDQGLPIICGAATPTEIHSALAAGATAVKVFPAAQLGGPEYLRAVLAPLSGAPLVPTGGVDPSNAAAYLDAGAVALGAGGSLFPARIALEKDWPALDERAQTWLESFR